MVVALTGPDLSLVVLTRNRKRLLRGCLGSLLEQQWPAGKMEIIVVDDGSTDGTAEMVRAHWNCANIRLLRRPHGGIPAARNTGVGAARGRFIAILADDYVLAPDYAPTIMRFFAGHPQASVVRFKVVAAAGDLASRISHFYFEVNVQRQMAAAGYTEPSRPDDARITTVHGLEAAGGAAYRREVFDRVGAFDESLKRAEDTDMTRRLRLAGIAVHYDPSHHIRHQYHPLLADTLAKCFRSGYYRGRYYEKLAATDEPHVWTWRAILASKVAWFRTAKRMAPWPMFLGYLPFIVIFEIVTHAGLLLYRWRHREDGKPD